MVNNSKKNLIYGADLKNTSVDGDTHIKLVTNSQKDISNLIKELKLNPKKIYLHDCFDTYSPNPHIFQNYKKTK